MSSPLQLAIVGCGGIAGYTAQVVRFNRKMRLAACCDLSPDRAAQFARRHGISQVFSDYDRLLQEGAMDAVYLAVPHHLHHQMLVAAIQAGLPTLVEKPVTRTLAEGREVVRLADDRGVKVGVNYQYRYDSGCFALARAVQAGALGQVYYVRCNVPWHRTEAYFRGAAWHARKATAGGGTLITQGSHILDIALWAVAQPPTAASGLIARRKFADVEVEDLAMGTVETADGTPIQITSSMVARPERPVTIEVYGQHGTAIYTNRPRPRVQFHDVRVRRRRPPHRGVHALQRSVEGFRAWVMEDRPYLTPAGEALPVLAAVEAIYRSAETGRSEPVQPWT